jgi:hypothetical protein
MASMAAPPVLNNDDRNRILPSLTKRVAGCSIASRDTGLPSAVRLGSLATAIADANAAGNSEDVADLSYLLYKQAQILDGEIPADAAAFTERLNRLVQRGIQ